MKGNLGDQDALRRVTLALPLLICCREGVTIHAGPVTDDHAEPDAADRVLGEEPVVSVPEVLPHVKRYEGITGFEEPPTKRVIP